MLKKYIILFLVIVLLLSLGGCATRHTANYLRRYRNFLNYSLGAFQVILTERGTIHQQWRGTTDTYRVWELQYTRGNGEETVFRFNNRVDFADSVIRVAGHMGAQELLGNDITRNYFTEEELGLDSRQPLSVVFYMQPAGSVPIHRGGRAAPRPAAIEQIQAVESFVILNAENGLQLSSVTARELVEDWGLTLQIFASHREGEDYADMAERFKELTRALSAYLNQDWVEIDFSVSGRDMGTEAALALSFSGYYNRLTDTFHIISHDGVLLCEEP